MPFSAFRGRPLSETNEGLGLAPALAELGVFDVEQLVGLGAIPEISPLLAAHLGFSERRLVSMLSQYRKQLSGTLADTLSHPLDADYYQLGAFLTPSPIAPPPKPHRRVIGKDLPTAVNRAGRMFPVQDQGQRGTCVAFGATALHEYFELVPPKPRIPLPKFSEQFLYQEIKLADGNGGCGTWLGAALSVLSKVGQCFAQDWAYNPNLPCNNNGTEPTIAQTRAKGFRARGEMLPANNVAAIKGSLADRSVVALCFSVFNSWYLSSAVRASGRLSMPVPGEAPLSSGHCMCAVGYQDDKAYPGGGYFIVRNSWGTGWASQSPYGAGYGVIPYQYIALYGTEAAHMPQRKGGPMT